MFDLSDFERRYNCKAMQSENWITKVGPFNNRVEVHEDYEVIHSSQEPIFNIKIPWSDLERLLYDTEGIVSDEELHDKHIELQKAYHQYLMLKALYK
jgi:hypothetical protein